MKQYMVVPYFTGCMSGTINETKLTGALNENAARGWVLRTTIHETKKVWGIFSRESHFLIFERDQQ